LRSQWKEATPADVRQLVEFISTWQAVLFKFNSAGQIGLQQDVKSWLAPVSPVQTQQVFRIKLPLAATKDVVLSLRSDDAGNGNLNDVVLWERPRFVSPGRPDLFLKDVHRVAVELAHIRERHFAQTTRALAIVAAAEQAQSLVELKLLAEQNQVEVETLAAW